MVDLSLLASLNQSYSQRLPTSFGTGEILGSASIRSVPIKRPFGIKNEPVWRSSSRELDVLTVNIDLPTRVVPLVE